MSQTDSEYVRLCLNGHPEVFRHLVTRYEAPLIKRLTGRLRDRHEAAEAAQETMVRAYFALPKLRNAESFSSWLLGIADRVAQEMGRAGRRHAVAFDDRSESAKSDEESNPGACQDIELSRAVAELPELYRQVILLRFYGGQSCTEISANLCVSLGTVTSRLSRAYLLLRKTLHKDDQRGEGPL